MEAVSNEFSEALWKQTIIVFTHGRITALPQGTSYGNSPLCLSDS